MINSPNSSLLLLAARAEDECRRRERERKEQEAVDASALSFCEFIQRASPSYQFYKYTDHLIGVLQRVADGELKRVMIFLPPRHSKSETVSRLFTAYFLHRYPHQWVGLCCHTADLAYTLSRNARENYNRAGGRFNEHSTAVKHWESGRGGGFWAADIGGPIAGKGFHLAVLDDPVKNSEEAASEKLREKQKDWYVSTFYNREEPWSNKDPTSPIVVVSTRWREDDLCGYLLSEETEGEEPEKWHIVNLPAIAEDARPDFPDTCTIESDWRKPGEALCPERRPIEKLNKICKRIGQYFFDALFQQRPSAKEGEFFKLSKVEMVDAEPASIRKCRAWDLAASKGAGAFTSGVLIGVDEKTGIYYVLDVVRGQWSAEEARAMIKNTAIEDGKGVSIHLPQDPGQAGKAQAEQFVKFLAGFNVKTEPVTGSKETRAFGFAAQWNSGNVKLVMGSWVKAFKEEFRQFPRGKYKDQVDSGSDAFNVLAARKGEFKVTPFRM